MSKPQDRVAGVRSIIERLGGEFEHLDFCLGEYDVVATYSAPDDTTAAALAIEGLSVSGLYAQSSLELTAANPLV